MKIERIVKKSFETYEFPLSETEIEDILKKLPPKDLEGLEKVIITPPIKNEDFKRFGRYEKGKILLFAHQKKDENFIIELGYQVTVRLTPKDFKNRAIQAVLHETGHHVGIKNFGDSSETFANDYQSENLRKYFLHLLE